MRNFKVFFLHEQEHIRRFPNLHWRTFNINNELLCSPLKGESLLQHCHLPWYFEKEAFAWSVSNISRKKTTGQLNLVS